METRENNGVLAGVERRTLVWLAQRMPARINSDHLTAIGVAGMAMAAAGFWLGAAWPEGLLLVPVGLAVNWFGDSLDGTLARVRNQQRPRYGYYVDHVLDAVGILMLFAGLAASGFMTPIAALAVVAAYYLVSIEVYLATHALGTFRLSFWKLGPTELRIVLAAGAVALLWRPSISVLGRDLLLFDVGGAVAVLGLLLATAVSAAANARALYLEERV